MLLESGGCYRWKGLSKKLLDGITFLKGGKIDSSKVDAVLGNMDMDLTEKELKDIIHLPVDVKGKVDLERLMNEVKSFSGGNVDVNKLDTLLENMGISIKEREFMDLIERLPDADEGKVKLNTLMEELSTVLGEQVDVSDVCDALKDRKVEVTEKEYFSKNSTT
ncbi:uncharacterized protein AAEQ78_013123 isoform 3-T6 [Lycaon pictus]